MSTGQQAQLLSGKIAALYGSEGLPDGTIRCIFNGSAGQSFGAFLVSGVEYYLKVMQNDYPSARDCREEG